MSQGRLLSVARLDLLAAVRRAAKSIWLASPFISLPVARVLVDAAQGSGAADMRLLTALDVRSVCPGVLDPKALRALREGGFSVSTIENLHAKAALVDGSWALIGSGNLTNAGLGAEDGDFAQMNVELGVILAPQLTAEAVERYEHWWATATPVDAQMIDSYDALERWRLPRTKRLDRGATLVAPTNESIERILAEDDAAASSRGYWMKAAYYRPGQDEDGWWRRHWISDRRPPPYAVGDLIVLYVGGDGAPKRCPAVLRVTAPAREDGDFVEANGRGPEDRRWPFVTETDCVFDVPMAVAPRPASFGIDPRSTQPGYRALSRDQFEAAVRLMSGA